MKRFWILALFAGIGVCAGIALDEGWRAISSHKLQAESRGSNELFQHRLRCKTVADDYAKENSDNSSSLLLERVDFSPTRHSCVAAFTRWRTGKVEIRDYETIDLLSGETLFTDDCIENDATDRKFCGNGRDMKLDEERSKALEAALTSEK